MPRESYAINDPFTIMERLARPSKEEQGDMHDTVMHCVELLATWYYDVVNNTDRLATSKTRAEVALLYAQPKMARYKAKWAECALYATGLTAQDLVLPDQPTTRTPTFYTLLARVNDNMSKVYPGFTPRMQRINDAVTAYTQYCKAAPLTLERHRMAYCAVMRRVLPYIALGAHKHNTMRRALDQLVQYNYTIPAKPTKQPRVKHVLPPRPYVNMYL